jgi:site-specific DNA-cytosine methylase
MRGKKLKVLELFAGTRSISKQFEARGHECFTVELDKQHEGISWYGDILDLTPEMVIDMIGEAPQVIWASPPCTSYSIAAISRHRTAEANGNLAPKSDFAKLSDEILAHTIYLIQKLRPKYWYIENPRGGMRKMDIMQMLPRHTVWYCQYGDIRAKPTDIWTNYPDPGFKTCHNGNKNCHHEPAPRGSKTGTQGLKNAKDRSIIPADLCKYIAEISER